MANFGRYAKVERKIRMSRKKKCGALIVIMSASLLLTGCGNQIPDMTEEQQQEISEYAAVILLLADAHSRGRLIEVPEELLISDNTQVSPEQSPAGMDPVEDTPTIEVGEETASSGAQKVEEVLGLPEGVTLTYQSYSVTDSYPEEADDSNYFALDATEGKRLLVLKFQLTNQTAETQAIDLLSANILYRITVNGNYSRTALTTMLLNDLSTYSGTLDAGAQSEVVLLLEIEQTAEDQILSVSMDVRNGSITYTNPVF